MMSITIPDLSPVSIDKNAQPVVEIRHLYKSFGTNHVLRDFNLSLNKGENIVVLGKSGSGKSVLIKCIIGLLKPDKGEISVLGQDVLALDHTAMDELRAKIGFLFQSNALYDSLTVRENLEFPLRRHWIKVTQSQIQEMVTQALDDVGLKHTINMLPSELSGGMKKRIALARTLILKPDIILYDEPTTGLDPITGKEIIELMVEIKQKYNTSSLIISHDLTCVRMASDRVAVLVNGTCYACDTYEHLKEYTDTNVKQFFEN